MQGNPWFAHGSLFVFYSNKQAWFFEIRLFFLPII